MVTPTHSPFSLCSFCPSFVCEWSAEAVWSHAHSEVIKMCKCCGPGSECPVRTAGKLRSLSNFFYVNLFFQGKRTIFKPLQILICHLFSYEHPLSICFSFTAKIQMCWECKMSGVRAFLGERSFWLPTCPRIKQHQHVSFSWINKKFRTEMLQFSFYSLEVVQTE